LSWFHAVFLIATRHADRISDKSVVSRERVDESTVNKIRAHTHYKL